MRSFTAIVNPAAGGDAAAMLLPVARSLREGGATVTVEYSRSLEHAGDLARAAVARGDVVVGVGGDGMVGCLAGVLAGTNGVLGVLPVGRGNDFARQLELPTETTAVSALLREAEPRKVDLIEVNNKVVAGSVYAGIDSVANVYVNRTRLPGSAAYHYAALRAMVTWRPATFRLTVDGTPYEERGYAIVAANSGFYGYGRHVAPDAQVDDGLLDVVILRHAPKRVFISVAMKEIYAGTHVRRPEVEVLRGREVRVEADRELPLGADGELIGTLPAVVRIIPGGLRILTG